MGTDLTEKSSDASSQELEKLLKLAEDLQEKIEGRERRGIMQVSVAVLLVLLGATIGIYTLFAPWDGWADREFRLILSGTLIISLCYGVLIFIFLWGRTARALRTDRRALFSIVDMLREIEKAFADTHQMTTLERAEFRIRLSRFDIGPGTMPWSR